MEGQSFGAAVDSFAAAYRVYLSWQSRETVQRDKQSAKAIGDLSTIQSPRWNRPLPNKRLQPTIAPVTLCAGAQTEPATLATEANVRQAEMEVRACFVKSMNTS